MFAKRGHRLFQIANTRMLGLGLEAMRPGDVVVSLHGAMGPFMLRTAGEGLRKLVGECQLYDFGQGRIVRGWKRRAGVSDVLYLLDKAEAGRILKVIFRSSHSTICGYVSSRSTKVACSYL